MPQLDGRMVPQNVSRGTLWTTGTLTRSWIPTITGYTAPGNFLISGYYQIPTKSKNVEVLTSGVNALDVPRSALSKKYRVEGSAGTLDPSKCTETKWQLGMAQVPFAPMP